MKENDDLISTKDKSFAYENADDNNENIPRVKSPMGEHGVPLIVEIQNDSDDESEGKQVSPSKKVEGCDKDDIDETNITLSPSQELDQSDHDKELIVSFDFQRSDELEDFILNFSIPQSQRKKLRDLYESAKVGNEVYRQASLAIEQQTGITTSLDSEAIHVPNREQNIQNRIDRWKQEMQRGLDRINKFYDLIEKYVIEKEDAIIKNNHDYLVNKVDGIYDAPPGQKFKLKADLTRSDCYHEELVHNNGETILLNDLRTQSEKERRDRRITNIQNAKYVDKRIKDKHQKIQQKRSIQQHIQREQDKYTNSVNNTHNENSFDESTEDSDTQTQNTPTINKYDPSEDDEGQESLEHTEEEKPWVNFKYQKMHTILWLFQYRRTHTDSLPGDIIEKLLPEIVRINSLGWVAYRNMTRTNDTCKRYLNKYISEDYDKYERLLQSLDNFYYHSAKPVSKNATFLSQANSKYANQNRQQSNYLNTNYTYVHLPNKNWLFAGLFFIYVLWRRRRNRNKNNLPAAILPSFPRASAIVEECIRSFPGGNWLIKKIETFLNANNKTEVFHDYLSRFSFLERLKEHLEYNAAKTSTQFTFNTQYAEWVRSIIRIYPLAKVSKMEFWLFHIVAAKNRSWFLVPLIYTILRGPVGLYQVLPRSIPQSVIIGLLWLFFKVSTQHSLFPQLGIVSIYIEELIKCLPGGYKFVALLERIKNGNWRTYKWHRNSVKTPFFQRIEKHKTLNAQSVLKQEYELHVTKELQHSFTEIIEYPNTTDMPCFQLPLVIDKPHREYATYQDQTGKVESKNQVWHGIFWGVNHMASPANTFENMAATVEERVRRHENSVVKHRAPVVKVYKTLFSKFHLQHVDIPNWQDGLKPRQKENLKKAEENRKNGHIPKYIKTQLKCDEHLLFYEKGVARFLVNASQEEFLAQGKITAEISYWLSEFQWGPDSMNPFIVNYKGVQYKFLVYFVCGGTGDKIKAFQNHLKGSGVIGLMALGDDSHLKDDKRKDNVVVENDYRRYDRTNSTDLRQPLQELLRRSGFSELAREKEKMYKRNLKLFVPNHNKGRVNPKLLNVVDNKGKKADMLYTGQAGTCLDNSIINVFATISVWVVTQGRVNLMEEEYFKFGLIAKLKELPMNRSTFLKGVFLENVHGEFDWVRLASYKLKFGKTLEHPNLIIKSRKLTLVEKCKIILRGQALGYGSMRTNWFYEKFFTLVLRATEHKHENYVVEMEEWQIKQHKTWIRDDTWNSFMMSRYKITIEEQVSFLQTVEQALSPAQFPCLYHHPLLLKLEIDY